MTKEEILDALEGLKDFTNDSGKRAIDGIKASVHALEEPAAKPVLPEPEEPVHEEKPEPEEPIHEDVPEPEVPRIVKKTAVKHKVVKRSKR